MPETEKKRMIVIKSKVHKKIKRIVMKEMITYFSNSPNLALWGETKPRNFIQDTTYLVFYHDVENIGWNCLVGDLEISYKITSWSLRYNATIIRSHLKKWAELKILPGNLEEWKRAKRRMQFDDRLKDAHLWIDSSDFRIKGKESTSRRDAKWSYKENSPAQRFQFVCNAKQRIWKI